MKLNDLLRRARIDDRVSLHALCVELCRQGYQQMSAPPDAPLELDDISKLLTCEHPEFVLRDLKGVSAEFRYRRTQTGRSVHIAPISLGEWHHHYGVLCQGANSYVDCDPPKDTTLLCCTCLKSLRSALHSIQEGKKPRNWYL